MSNLVWRGVVQFTWVGDFCPLRLGNQMQYVRSLTSVTPLLNGDKTLPPPDTVNMTLGHRETVRKHFFPFFVFILYTRLLAISWLNTKCDGILSSIRIWTKRCVAGEGGGYRRSGQQSPRGVWINIVNASISFSAFGTLKIIEPLQGKLDNYDLKLSIFVGGVFCVYSDRKPKTLATPLEPSICYWPVEDTHGRLKFMFWNVGNHLIEDWRLSAMWNCAIGWLIPDVSEDRSTLIFRVKWCDLSKRRELSRNETALYSRRLESPYVPLW